MIATDLLKNESGPTERESGADGIRKFIQRLQVSGRTLIWTVIIAGASIYALSEAFSTKPEMQPTQHLSKMENGSLENKSFVLVDAKTGRQIIVDLSVNSNISARLNGKEFTSAQNIRGMVSKIECKGGRMIIRLAIPGTSLEASEQELFDACDAALQSPSEKAYVTCTYTMIVRSPVPQFIPDMVTHDQQLIELKRVSPKLTGFMH